MTKPIVSLIVSMLLASSVAQASPYENRFEKVAATYTFKIETSLHSKTRTRFYRPVFLFANRLEKVRAETMLTSMTLDVHWTDQLALQFKLPLVARKVFAKFSPVKISETQILPSQTRNYLDFGPGDPTLSLSWLAWEKSYFNFYTEVGTTLPLDDNSGSTILPTKIPSSTGQNSIFATLGTNISWSSLRMNLQYQAHYFPGNAASYLIHQAATQTWLSGSLSAFQKHHIHARFHASPTKQLTLELTPGWTVTQVPKLIVRGAAAEDTNVQFLEDLYLTGALVWNLSKRYSLKVWYRSTLIDSTDVNPFFPIDVPLQGGGLSFTAKRW